MKSPITGTPSRPRGPHIGGKEPRSRWRSTTPTPALNHANLGPSRWRPSAPHPAPSTANTQRLTRVESERFRAFTYDELVARDKANLDITWLKDDSLTDLDSLPSPDVIAREIVEDLTAALAEFEAVTASLEAQLNRN